MEMPKQVTESQLERLRSITTPTISNAIEQLGVRRRDEGYTNASIKCIFPELGAIVGYACTALIRSAQPDSHPRHPSRKPYWDHLLKYPAPRIVVVQDLDQPPSGAQWGEVNANIHRALGCVGVITDGTVRDLDEVRALGFQFFASGIAVSHAYCHIEDFDIPVRVGGLIVRPGDLLHADKHGAITIPAGLVEEVISAATEVERYERPIIQLCKSEGFSTERLAELVGRPIK